MSLRDLSVENIFFETGAGEENICVIINQGRQQNQSERLIAEAQGMVPGLDEEDILRIEFENNSPGGTPREGIMFSVQEKPRGEWFDSGFKYPAYNLAS